jgi:hypothetical protein
MSSKTRLYKFVAREDGTWLVYQGKKMLLRDKDDGIFWSPKIVDDAIVAWPSLVRAAKALQICLRSNDTSDSPKQ